MLQDLYCLEYFCGVGSVVLAFRLGPRNVYDVCVWLYGVHVTGAPAAGSGDLGLAAWLGWQEVIKNHNIKSVLRCPK